MSQSHSFAEVDAYLIKVLSKHKRLAEAAYAESGSTELFHQDFVTPILDLLGVPANNVTDDEDGNRVSEEETYCRDFLYERFWHCDGSPSAIRDFIRGCRSEASTKKYLLVETYPVG